MDGGRSPPLSAPGAERPPVAAAANVCYIGESAPSTAAIGDEKWAAAAAGTICHAERRQCAEVVITHISFKTMQIYLMLLKLHNNI